MKLLKRFGNLFVFWGSWLNLHVNADRWLAIIGLVAGCILGGLGILASVSQRALLPVSLLIFALLGIIFLVILSFMRAKSGPASHLHPYPYETKQLKVIVEIKSLENNIATIQHIEEGVCLQDHVTAIRRSFWGDWDELKLEDLTCRSPEGAVVADCFAERYATIFVLSLRRLLNYGDKFRVNTTLTTRNGFRNVREFYTHTVIPKTSLLSIHIVAPNGVQFTLDECTTRREVFGQMYYNEWPLPFDCMQVRPDGRQELSHSWKDLEQGQTYGLYWSWKSTTPAVQGKV